MFCFVHFGCVSGTVVCCNPRDEKQLLYPLLAPRQRGVALLCCGFTTSILLTMVALAFALPPSAWGDDEQWLGGPKTYKQQAYCENYRSGLFMLQSANTLSNLFFVASGLCICFLGLADWREMRLAARKAHPETNADAATSNAAAAAPPNATAAAAASESHATLLFPLRLRPHWSIVMGLSEVYIGVGSYLFHAGHRPLTQTLDVAAIYCGMTALLLYSLLRILTLPPPPPPSSSSSSNTGHRYSTRASYCCPILPALLDGACLLLFVVFGAVLSFTEKHKLSSFTMLPALIGSLTVTLALHAVLFASPCCGGKRPCGPAGLGRSRQRWAILVAAFVALAAGYCARVLDKALCDLAPGQNDQWSAWQWHALWHVLTGLAFWLCYLFLRSEHYEVQGQGQGQAGGSSLVRPKKGNRSSVGPATMEAVALDVH